MKHAYSIQGKIKKQSYYFTIFFTLLLFLAIPKNTIYTKTEEQYENNQALQTPLSNNKRGFTVYIPRIENQNKESYDIYEIKVENQDDYNQLLKELLQLLDSSDVTLIKINEENIMVEISPAKRGNGPISGAIAGWVIRALGYGGLAAGAGALVVTTAGAGAAFVSGAAATAASTAVAGAAGSAATAAGVVAGGLVTAGAGEATAATIMAAGGIGAIETVANTATIALTLCPFLP